MAWSASKVFTAYIADALNTTAALNYAGDTIKAAIFNNSITPDQTVTSANTAYNVGQWASANEITSGSDITAGGLTLASKTTTRSSGNVVISAANTASGTSATGTGYGNLVYDSTLASPVAKQGMCFNYWGGAVTATSGTLTIVWDGTNGIMKFAA